MRTERQMATAAAEFAERWKGKGYERGQSQLFWADLLTNVFGVENLLEFLRYEEQVESMVDSTNFIDVHIPSTKVLIEQKSINIDLRKPIKKGDGFITPFLQAKLYIVNMPQNQHPKWVVTCNFKSFLVYDMNQPNKEPEEILLEDLGTEYYRLKFLVDAQSEHISKEMEVSMQAGEIVGRIYEALIAHPTPSQREGLTDADAYKEFLHDINVLCVRLVFCLYAEDAGIFGKRDMFHDYLAQFDAHHLRRALMNLFQVLNTPIAQRDPYLEPDLAQFPYINGGLFADQKPLPWGGDGGELEGLRTLLLHNASLDFDWSKISPTIFGAMFESTLNPETRRSGGMHYTSIENIHKVIDPLFLNDLRQEYDTILEEKVERTRQRKLDEFQMKLASLTFLDPACGSGNFLTETYLSLRRLENDVIRAKYHGQTMMGAFVNPIKVSIQQFYGIEINDFAVTVATTALWISEAQMLAETERIVQQEIDFLPLKPYHNIREGNALRMDWNVIELPSDIPTFYVKNAHVILEDEETWVAKEPDSYEEANIIAVKSDSSLKTETRRYNQHYDYIIGNPPFVGFTFMTSEQKKDVARMYPGIKNIDYVSCWFKKACDVTRMTDTECAFVATNSITQGETVGRMWERLDVTVNFAWPTFRWDSEATQKAHVHCVIIGFSHRERQHKYLYSEKGAKECKNINAYLLDAPDVIVSSRNKPLCDVPPMIYGNKPADGGHLIFTKEEKDEFLRREPKAKRWMHTLIGGTELINNKPNLNDKLRYTLWLEGISPAELRSMPAVMERIAACKAARENSPAAAIRKFAATPHLYAQRTQPNIPKLNDDGEPVLEGQEHYNLLVPEVSSEKRKYVPMGYVSNDIVTNNLVKLVPDASLYHFGVLTSKVHMAWMRAVCGRLEMRYRYSKDVVYNNFPWPAPTEEQKAKIAQTAQAILDARRRYPDSSLADLYDELAMPADLRKAHEDNDRAVMQAYGFPVKSTFTESLCVAELFRLYKEMTI